MRVALEPLWKIDETLLALMESIEICPDEMRDELQAEIELYIGKEAAKVDNCAHVLAALEYEQRCAADEIARLRIRGIATAKAQDRLEKYLCRIIANRGGKPMLGETNTLSVRTSDAVDITDESAVPDEWKVATVKMPCAVWHQIRAAAEDCGEDVDSVKVEISIPKDPIKKALKAGAEVPGADLEFRSNLQRK